MNFLGSFTRSFTTVEALGASWFRPDKVKAVSPFARMLQSTYSDLSQRKDPKNSPKVRVCQHLEDELTRAEARNDSILALTTTREGAQNLRL